MPQLPCLARIVDEHSTDRVLKKQTFVFEGSPAALKEMQSDLDKARVALPGSPVTLELGEGELSVGRDIKPADWVRVTEADDAERPQFLPEAFVGVSDLQFQRFVTENRFEKELLTWVMDNTELDLGIEIAAKTFEVPKARNVSEGHQPQVEVNFTKGDRASRFLLRSISEDKIRQIPNLGLLPGIGLDEPRLTLFGTQAAQQHVAQEEARRLERILRDNLITGRRL